MSNLTSVEANNRHGIRFAHIPERVLVQEMDRMVRLVEDSQRVHDTLAYELGYDRVRVESVKAGDVLREGEHWGKVESIAVWVEPDGFDSGFRAQVAVPDVGLVDRHYDAGQMVSRKRDESAEAF